MNKYPDLSEQINNNPLDYQNYSINNEDEFQQITDNNVQEY